LTILFYSRPIARRGTTDRGEYRQAAGAFAEAVIRSVELIVQPDAASEGWHSTGSIRETETADASRCSLWVISRHWSMSASCPLYPQKRTSVEHVRCPLCAKSGHSALRERLRYSITSLAATSIDCGTVIPSALAVLRLMTNSSFTACWIGRSVVLAPLRILPA